MIAPLARMLSAAALTLGASWLAPTASAQVKVAGDWVALGDVAPVSGEAAKILVAPAPPSGQTLALDPAFIVAVAQKSGVAVALPLDQPIWVARGTAPSPKAPPQPPRPLQARVAPTPSAALAPPTPPSATLLGDPPEPGWILVITRDVERGHTISAGDVKWTDPKQSPSARNAIEDASDAIGMDAKRPLRAGVVLQSSDIQPAASVRKGSPVRLVYTAPGLRISTEGVAQADAAIGESVRVLNSFTKRSMSAIVTGAGEASVSVTQERS